MHLNVLVLDEVESIISASGEQMCNFFPVLAAIDVIDQLLPSKDVVFVKRTAGLLVFLTLTEHLMPIQIDQLQIIVIILLSYQQDHTSLELSFVKLLHSIHFDIIIQSYLMLVEINDDPSVVLPVFEELRQNFNLNIAQSLDQREKSLKRLMEGYEALKPDFQEALKHDLGYNSFLSNFAAHAVSMGQIKDLHDNFRRWAKPRKVSTPVAVGLASCEIEPEPLGVALVISAWNYPIYTSLPQVAAAISAGNCVILKPSQLSPYCSKALKKLFDKYLDPRFYRVIEGKVQVAKALTKLKFDIICFTGSTETGRLVAIEAAKNLTPCILQLGGKCPVIIDQTADLQSAAKRIIFGKFLNCGQTCVGVDHIYAHEKIYNKFKAILLQEMKVAFSKEDLINSGNYGKINNANHLKRLKRFYEEEHGGKTIYGGKIIEEKLHFEPTLIQKPSQNSSLMNQQIFGPILPIQSYKDLKKLVSQIRNKPKPLAVYVYSEQEKNIGFVRSNTSSGAFVVNDSVVQLLNPHLPFGGVGESGYGRYHGESGFNGFSNLKSICSTKAYNGYPFSNRFFPFTPNKQRAMTFALKIGGTTYSQLAKGSAILAALIAGALGYLKLRPYL